MKKKVRTLLCFFTNHRTVNKEMATLKEQQRALIMQEKEVLANYTQEREGLENAYRNALFQAHRISFEATQDRGQRQQTMEVAQKKLELLEKGVESLRESALIEFEGGLYDAEKWRDDELDGLVVVGVRLNKGTDFVSATFHLETRAAGTLFWVKIYVLTAALTSTSNFVPRRKWSPTPQSISSTYY